MTQYSKFTPDQWSVVMAPDIVAATETQNADEAVPALTNCFYNVDTETFESGATEKKTVPVFAVAAAAEYVPNDKCRRDRLIDVIRLMFLNEHCYTDERMRVTEKGARWIETGATFLDIRPDPNSDERERILSMDTVLNRHNWSTEYLI